MSNYDHGCGHHHQPPPVYHEPHRDPESVPKYTLISATPSPYARKVRITLAEKKIPFTLQTEVPWDSTTVTPRHNPLEKLPILLLPKAKNLDGATNGHIDGAVDGESDDVTSVFESHHILDWIEVKHPSPPMLPPNAEDRLAAKEVEVVADGICDALVLRLWENKREEEKQSPQWKARQERKISGGLKWLDQKVRAARADGDEFFLIPGGFGLADVAAGALLGYMDVRAEDIKWQTQYPALKKYFDGLMRRESFKTTMPYAQSFKDKIV